MSLVMEAETLSRCCQQLTQHCHSHLVHLRPQNLMSQYFYETLRAVVI